MPPGKKIATLSTLMPSDFLSLLWSIGVGGCQVSVDTYQENSTTDFFPAHVEGTAYRNETTEGKSIARAK
jgi:hypothetical protein